MAITKFEDLTKENKEEIKEYFNDEKELCEWCGGGIGRLEPRHSKGKKLWHLTCLKHDLENKKGTIKVPTR